MDAAQRRDDEIAEIALRILVRLYDAWPSPVAVPKGSYRPGARYTGPDDALPVMRELLGRQISGTLGDSGLTDAKLRPRTRTRLDEVDGNGAPWIVRVRAVLDEASAPRLGHAAGVRDCVLG